MQHAGSNSHLSVYELLSVKKSQNFFYLCFMATEKTFAYSDAVALFLLSIWCLSADSPLQSYLMYEAVLFYIVLTII